MSVAQPGCPPAEIQVDASTVRRLLKAEGSELSEEPLSLVGEGWDNFTFRVGPRHAVRLPRRQVAVPLLENEQRWLPILGPRLHLEVPSPRHCGAPSAAFPWPWSVVDWIPGTTAETHHFRAADTVVLAETLVALHQPAPDDAPFNPYRGVPLETRSEAFGQRLGRLLHHPGIDASRLAAIWRDACAAPAAEERTWLHGDLHPRNVVVRDGSLVGLIDWGDLNGGDVATDLACAWMLLDTPSRRRDFFKAYGADETLVSRARGWAVLMGLALVASGEPQHVPLGLTTLNRIAADT